MLINKNLNICLNKKKAYKLYINNIIKINLNDVNIIIEKD